MRADEQGPDDAAAVAGDEAHVDVGVADAGGVGHEGGVAEQGDTGAEPGRRTVDRGDEGGFAVDHRLHQPFRAA